MKVYDVGERAPLSWRWTDANGTPVAVTAITVHVQAPDGTVTDPPYSLSSVPAINLVAGTYTLDVPCTAAGRWYYRMDAVLVGGRPVVEERGFTVRERIVPEPA